MDPLISMAALGRPIQLGDLYDYRSDTNFTSSIKRVNCLFNNFDFIYGMDFSLILC